MGIGDSRLGSRAGLFDVGHECFLPFSGTQIGVGPMCELLVPTLSSSVTKNGFPFLRIRFNTYTSSGRESMVSLGSFEPDKTSFSVPGHQEY